MGGAPGGLSVGCMRKCALILLAVVAILVIALAFLFRDQTLERQIERAAKLIVGARVEIDGFHLRL